ncbi:hypothetical protein B1A99_24985 [Cohnella sp. CIP 111063]|uniref:DNA cytosine methyltransferase n=1 Tax=unclassified Cohnella TaxID=2636738 RepID=UPI000B8C4438|nr:MULTISPECIES: DNA cytosine methyltransferase [unclassified Cohnella]OXS55038.1 hypothetical protein B1A99_24985 [Cohnella sp. CIP 111063]PRX65172.1 site-specific DNA-cytosine methylase [Cohnella sp. SGD-V74]
MGAQPISKFNVIPVCKADFAGSYWGNGGNAPSEQVQTEFTVAYLFGGVGGGAIGVQRSRGHYKGTVGRFRSLCSIDADPIASKNYERLTGNKGTGKVIDLFSYKQYVAFHGKRPPADWKECTPWDLWEAFGYIVPDLILTSPPCKGFSGLLPEKSSKTAKYQALNQLTIRGLTLTLEACEQYGDALPKIIALENVPRIKTRGKEILKEIVDLLKRKGYAVTGYDHDLGLTGGLGQIRKRYLLVARLERVMTSFIFKPEQKKHRTIGDVLGNLPLPGDVIHGGRLNRLPNLSFKTWLRLALIPKKGDWRDLNKIDWWNYRLTHVPRGGGAWGVQDWDEPSTAVIGKSRVGGSNASAVADVRIGHLPRAGAYEVGDWEKPSRTVTGAQGVGTSNGCSAISDPRFQINEGNGKANLMRIMQVDEPAACITGSAGPTNGAACIADPTLKERASRHPAVYKIVSVDDPAPCVTGTRLGSGQFAIADPGKVKDMYPGGYGVNDWHGVSDTIRSQGRVMNAPVSIADVRLPLPSCGGRYTNKWQMEDWMGVAATITGAPDIQSGAPSINDPRLTCNPRAGTMGVMPADEPAKTIIGSADIHAATSAVADDWFSFEDLSGTGEPDSEIPADDDRGVFIILSKDGTWHRPLTTMELGAIQTLPMTLPDGTPFDLVDCSEAKAREYIGNAIPPDAAEEVGNVFLDALMISSVGEFTMGFEEVWVHPHDDDERTYAILMQ